MKKKIYELVYEYDDSKRVEEAVESLYQDYLNNITNLSYMQIPSKDNVFKEITHKAIYRRIHEEEFNGKNARQRTSSKRMTYVISLNVKTPSKTHEIHNVLWSCGGCESNKNKGWYKERAKQIYQIIVDKTELNSIMKEINRNNDSSPVEGFGI